MRDGVDHVGQVAHRLPTAAAFSRAATAAASALRREVEEVGLDAAPPAGCGWRWRGSRGTGRRRARLAIAVRSSSGTNVSVRRVSTTSMPASAARIFSTRSATSSTTSASVVFVPGARILAAVARVDDDARDAEPELPRDREAAGAVLGRRARHERQRDDRRRGGAASAWRAVRVDRAGRTPPRSSPGGRPRGGRIAARTISGWVRRVAQQLGRLRERRASSAPARAVDGAARASGRERRVVDGEQRLDDDDPRRRRDGTRRRPARRHGARAAAPAAAAPAPASTRAARPPSAPARCAAPRRGRVAAVRRGESRRRSRRRQRPGRPAGGAGCRSMVSRNGW